MNAAELKVLVITQKKTKFLNGILQLQSTSISGNKFLRLLLRVIVLIGISSNSYKGVIPFKTDKYYYYHSRIYT